MKRKIIYRTAEEKLKIIHDFQRLGVVAGCRKHGITSPTYYNWLRKYEKEGPAGLKDGRKENLDRALQAKDKEIKLLKEIIVDKELKLKMQQEVIEKKFKAWKKRKT